jgi:PAS domain S-box-containing protein
VVDGSGRLGGLITKSHLIKAQAKNQMDRQVGEIMSTGVFTLRDNVYLSKLQNPNRIFQYSVFPIVDAENRPIGIISRTDLIKYLSEKSILMAEEMQAVLNSMYNGVVAINTECIVTMFNHAAEAITGQSAANAIGRPVDDVMPNTGLRRVLETGNPELNQKQNLGSCQILTNRSPILKGNKVVGAVAIFQDITQFEAIAAELEEVKSLKSTLESALESFFENIVIVDKKGYIKMMNSSYGDYLGLDHREVIGKHVTEVIDNTRMHIVAATGKAEIAEIQRIRDKDCVVTRIPIIKDGEVIGAVGKSVFKDPKDLKAMARQINSLQHQLEYYKEELRKVQGGKYTFDSIVGRSEKMEWLKTVATRAAKGNSTVLILGESGTGKELFAHAIHNASNPNSSATTKEPSPAPAAAASPANSNSPTAAPSSSTKSAT